MRLLKHHISGAHLHTCPAARAGFRIHEKNATINLYSVFRAIVGADTALIAEADTVIARSRQSSFNTKQRFGWIDFLEIHNGTCQPACTAA
jgi:hypothetical protein